LRRILCPNWSRNTKRTVTKSPFDLQKIRNLGRDGGFATQAWDEIDLQDKVNELVTKGLIEDLTGGRYQISDLGIQRYVM
jgi:hypothetical protein